MSLHTAFDTAIHFFPPKTKMFLVVVVGSFCRCCFVSFPFFFLLGIVFFKKKDNVSVCVNMNETMNVGGGEGVDSRKTTVDEHLNNRNAILNEGVGVDTDLNMDAVNGKKVVKEHQRQEEIIVKAQQEAEKLKIKLHASKLNFALLESYTRSLETECSVIQLDLKKV
eukprot:m.108669 g.108669  ORF g.108669 m.108669 type:complete len:167 (-) comp9192_c0_seq19:598-1098(-)